MAAYPELQLQSLIIKPLPVVKRCHLHLKSDGSERSYLLAKFMVGEQVKYILEVDTSDNKRQISTRIFSLQDQLLETVFIKMVLSSLLRRSLSWHARLFDKYCIEVSRIKHPRLKDEYSSKWIQRLSRGLLLKP